MTQKEQSVGGFIRFISIFFYCFYLKIDLKLPTSQHANFQELFYDIQQFRSQFSFYLHSRLICDLQGKNFVSDKIYISR